MRFRKTQSLNQWAEMLHWIYGNTQNYAKAPAELHSHLTEVTGAFGKHLFKRRDYESARAFLPKMMGWSISLYLKVKGHPVDIERAILEKYPDCCSYCLQPKCKCWRGEKSAANEAEVRDRYFRLSNPKGRTLNDFQQMFSAIYDESWGLVPAGDPGTASADLSRMFSRLVEELAEVAEAMRFNHLYPSHLDNEMADYWAWWFAIASNIHRLDAESRPILAEDLMWPAYPGNCVSCGLDRCDCRPGPVRDLLSKPSMSDLAFVDSLTQAENRRAFDQALDDIRSVETVVSHPLACVRIDVDDFSAVNNEISHEAGDAALRQIATFVRRKIRQRDRLFRVGGDEFAVICHDLSAAEAEGMMSRVLASLKENPIRGKNRLGVDKESVLTLSVGVTECMDPAMIRADFERADHAAMGSKASGKARITRG